MILLKQINILYSVSKYPYGETVKYSLVREEINVICHREVGFKSRKNNS